MRLADRAEEKQEGEGRKVEPAAGKDKVLGDHIREVGSPAARLIGFEVPESGNGRALVTLQAGPQHANPMGTIHGGILCDIADAAMGIAFSTTLEPGETFTTVELKINFIRPVREAKLVAEGKVAHRGRTIGYVECDVIDENGKLVAKSNSTCLVLRGEKAAGR